MTARQHGEAWEHPFVSVYEPFTSSKGKSIEKISSFEDQNNSKGFVGLNITHTSGRKDLVFSTVNNQTATYGEVSTNATYALIGTEKNENVVLFMGNGTQLKTKDFVIASVEKGNVVLELKDGKLYLHNEVPVKILIEGVANDYPVGPYRLIK